MSMAKDKLKVAVLMGGISQERDISLLSGRMITRALERGGADVVPFDITPDNLSILDDPDIDVFFPALHGEFGEDGRPQEILEERGLCYAGCGPASSRLAFDKLACKEALKATNVLLPSDICVKDGDEISDLAERISQLGDKFVVKPVANGSSFGVRILAEAQMAAAIAIETCSEFGDCMVEQFIAGKEITVGILDGRALPIIEIRSKTQFYDYEAKYEDDSTEFLFDTIADNGLTSRIQADAVECFKTIGCRHLSRVDMILNEEGQPYFLEINTLPGFTDHSLLPMAAAKIGISAEKLCMDIVQAAIRDHQKKG